MLLASMAYLSRRQFVHLAATGAAASALPRMAGWARRPAIDCLALNGPEFDPRTALRAGMSAAVLDLPIYPRTKIAATHALERWAKAFAAQDSRFHPVVRAADFEVARERGKLGVVIACQDASILDSPSLSVDDGNLINLRRFYRSRLRVLQLAHNDRNGVADSYRETTDAGLSRLGLAVVAEMNRLGMLIDLSHCSERTVAQTLEVSTRPCIVTHAGCRAIYPSARNKSDDQIRALAARGGLFCVFAMSLWLTDQATSSVDDVVRHIDHAVELVGIDHVGFASDGPALGVRSVAGELAGMRRYAVAHRGEPGSERIPTHVRPAELAGPDRLAVLASALEASGHAAADVDRIMGGNFERLFGAVCG